MNMDKQRHELDKQREEFPRCGCTRCPSQTLKKKLVLFSVLCAPLSWSDSWGQCGRAMREARGEEMSWIDMLWLSPLCQILSALERLSSLHPVSILARKRLDVSLRDLGRACRLSIKALLLRGAANEDVREEAVMEVSRTWLPARSNQRQDRLCSHDVFQLLLFLYRGPSAPSLTPSTM